MPQSAKFGEIPSIQGIADDEPIFILAASDPVAAGVIEFYGEMLAKYKADRKSESECKAIAAEFREWRRTTKGRHL